MSTMPLPARISELGAHEVNRARIVVLHAPREAPQEQTAWSLSLVDIGGRVMARDHLTAPDCPHPLTDIVRPYLDLIGRAVDGEWISDLDADGEVRHRARLC
ncbi:hypothetical protein [Cellulomonas sp. RIT-PI-Y]|uniref:hypothetical protein n=1 Tax=Cellulomonas sp. RIT-PI-Y TaxID=3035297 RepID=UPI0021DB4C21|nr:hypothetical protein [Cellulomonas sp. RIT-PI-Y]